MDAFFAGMSTVLSSLGANGILPIMLLILGLIFGLKFTEALRAALTGACGMVGMNLVTDMLVAKMSPATTAMVERLGWQLDIVDTGWSLINYGWGAPAAGILIIMGIGLNLLLLFTNFTKTLMIDFWNYWSFLACGGLIYAATDGSVLWSCVGTAIYMIITWKWSDIVAPTFQEASGMEGCTWPTGAIIAPLMIGLPVIKLCQKIPGIRSVKADPESLQNKLGVFGETMVMGSVIGLIIGILAGFKPVDCWLLAVNVGAVMVLLPRMISIMIMTPIVTAMSIIPGNRMLAVASLVAVPWFIIPLAYYAKDNILHTCIAATVVFAVYFWCATALAGAHTHLAVMEGVLSNADTLTSCLSEGGNPITWIIYKILELFGQVSY